MMGRLSGLRYRNRGRKLQKPLPAPGLGSAVCYGARRRRCPSDEQWS